MEQQKIKGVQTPTTTEAEKVEKQVQQEKARFKNVSEMTKEEILALPVCQMKLSAEKTRTKKREYYTLTFTPNATLSIPKNIEQSMYYILLSLFGVQAQYNSYNLKCHYRIVRSERVDGEHSGDVFDSKSYYYYFEGIVNRKLIFRSFLSNVQVLQIKLTGLSKLLHIVDRPMVDANDITSNIDDITLDDITDEDEEEVK